VSAKEIDPQVPLNSYVLDSVSAVTIATELQDWLGRTISPTVLYDSPSLSVVADRLTDLSNPLPDGSQPSLALRESRVEDLSPRQLDDVLARLLDNTATVSGGETQAH